MAAGFNSPKVHLYIGDGYEFVKQQQEEFDVIITDSSDPKGFFNSKVFSTIVVFKGSL